MTVSELLASLRERDIVLRVNGGKLQCTAPAGALSPELADAIRTHKPELLELLSAEPVLAAAGGQTIPRAPKQARHPLSAAQVRHVATGRADGALPTAFRLRGPLDASALERTLAAIVARHEPLRARFHFPDHEDPSQEILDAVPVRLSIVDLGGRAAGERQEALQELLRSESRQGIDPTREPPFRFLGVRLSDEDHVLFTAFSPLAFDGWSFDVFWRELRQGYAALARGDAWPFPPLPTSYTDYVAWQRTRLGETLDRDVRFWRDHLGLEMPAPPLPTDRPRPRIAANERAGNLPFALPLETAQAARRFALQNGVTLQMVMLAALYLLAHRLRGRRDIVVATPVEARVAPALEALIGPCVNMMLLRLALDPSSSFLALVRAVRALCLAAYDHQELPLERLDLRTKANASGAPNPICQLEFSYQQVSQRDGHMGPLALSQIELESGAASYDLTLWVKDWGDRVSGALEYRRDLFDRDTVAHWSECYVELVRAGVSAPETPLARLPLGALEGTLGAAAAHACDRLSELARDRLPADAIARATGLTVVDEHGQPAPFGAEGRLRLALPEGVRETDLRVKLRPDGALEEAEATDAVDVTPRAAHEPAATDAEATIAAHFAELLGRKVGVLDDWFASGGNSLLALKLFERLRQDFGRRLPLATLLEAGTPRALAARFGEGAPAKHTESAPAKCLVTLRPASTRAPARNLFLVHDADGETLLYLHLARRMPEDVGVYAFAPASSGRVPAILTSIEEMARRYVTEMRAVQPVGPYHLGGLCAGGLVAFEMAHQLEAAGETVTELVLLESAPPTVRQRPEAELGRQRLGRVRGLFADAGWAQAPAIARAAAAKVRNAAAYELGTRSKRARTQALIALLRGVYRGGNGWPAWLPVATPRDVFLHAEAGYEPRPLARTSAVLVRATEGSGPEIPYRELFLDPCFDWGPLVPAGVRVADVPGGHSFMLQEPHVAAIVGAIVRSFAGAQREERAA